MTGALISHLPVGATLYDWLMFGHVLAAMIWLGGWVTLSILAKQALRHQDPDTLARFAATMRFIGPRLFAPATLLVAGLGAWLVLDSHQWHFRQFWIELAIGLFAGVFVIGAGFQSRAAIGAERALADGNADQAARHITHWAWGSLAILLLLIAATWDMTVKP
jgi:putative copper export protein